MAVLAIISLVCLAAATRLSPDSFTHGWGTALEGQFSDFGYSLLSKKDAIFAATHYGMVSLEKCTGYPGVSTEAGIYATAAQLKTYNSNMRVFFYWPVDQQSLNCYAAYDEFMKHPDWWLRDDTGALVNFSATVPLMDASIKAARDWWVSVPLNGSGSPAAGIIDGALIDHTGSRCPSSKISAARCANYTAGVSIMSRELQALFDATNGGVVIGNGIVPTETTTCIQ
jgi:hypothetical protein